MTPQLKIEKIFFRLKKEKEAIKYRVIRDTRHLLEHEEKENYCNPLKIGNFWNNNYIEY